jgi:hypothetical protein
MRAEAAIRKAWVSGLILGISWESTADNWIDLTGCAGLLRPPELVLYDAPLLAGLSRADS